MPPASWGRLVVWAMVRCCYPALAPVLLQLLLPVSLLPAMCARRGMAASLPGHDGAAGMLLLSLALAPSYVVLDWCLTLVAVLREWLFVGCLQAGRPWRWYGS